MAAEWTEESLRDERCRRTNASPRTEASPRAGLSPRADRHERADRYERADGHERIHPHERTDRRGTADFEIHQALSVLRRATGLPVAFGGPVHPAGSGAGHGRPGVTITELSGTATLALQALVVTSGNGLGGKAAALLRPFAVSDYATSRRISHEYDAAVAAEGLRSVLAVPVVVRRQVRAVLYGALRTAQPLGDRVLDAAVDTARDAARSLALREEEPHALGTASVPSAARDEVPGTEAGTTDFTDAAAPERVRAAYAALRTLTARVTDPALYSELDAICALLNDRAPEVRSAKPGASVSLTPRELDVLACVATGASNASAADRLGLRPETVKGYLASAMRKLGAHGRWQAVVAARRAGLLP